MQNGTELKETAILDALVGVVYIALSFSVFIGIFSRRFTSLWQT